jgi:hypothetical protein
LRLAGQLREIVTVVDGTTAGPLSGVPDLAPIRPDQLHLVDADVRGVVGQA